jgi:carbon monoxide dehydrogenase subunit G
MGDSTFVIEHTIEVDCTPEQLWPFLEDPELQKKWMHGLESNEVIEEKEGHIGTRMKLGIREGGKITEYKAEITELSRPKRLALIMEGGCGTPFEMHVLYVLSETSPGTTQVDYSCRCTMQGKLKWWEKLMMPLGKIMARMQVKKFFRSLKELAEAEAAA